MSTDGHTHTHTRTDAKRFYYLSHAICYSYGADNYSQHCEAVLFPEWSGAVGGTKFTRRDEARRRAVDRFHEGASGRQSDLPTASLSHRHTHTITTHKPALTRVQNTPAPAPFLCLVTLTFCPSRTHGGTFQCQVWWSVVAVHVTSVAVTASSLKLVQYSASTDNTNSLCDQTHWVTLSFTKTLV